METKMNVIEFANSYLRPAFNMIYEKYMNHTITKTTALEWGSTLMLTQKLVEECEIKPDNAIVSIYNEFIKKMEGNDEC